MQSHIKSKHTGALATFDKLCKAYNNRQQKDTDKNNARTGTCDKSNKLVSSSTGLTSPTILTQTNFDLFVTKYIVESGLPFNNIDSDAFHNFIKQVAPKMILKSRKVYSAKVEELTKFLKLSYRKILAKLKKDVSRQITGQAIKKDLLDSQHTGTPTNYKDKMLALPYIE